MKSLVKLREAEVLTTGLFPSLPVNQLALWKEGENILFGEGRVEKLAGYTDEATTVSGEDILAFAQAYVDNAERVYYGTEGYLYRWAQGIQTQIGSGYTGTDWSLEPWGSFLLATNDVNPIQLYSNAGVADDLTGTNFTRAKVVKKLENHVIVFNTDLDGQEGRWCSKSNINLWEPDTDNSAGGLPVRDLDSDILAAEPFGDALGFYSSGGFGICQYVGSPFWFGMRKRLEGIGTVGQHAIVPVGNEHYGFGPNGIFRNNGVSFLYVDTPAIKRWIKDNADPLYLHQVRGVHYQAKDMVAWSFRCKDTVTRGVGFNYKNGSWTIFVLPATAWDNAQVIEGESSGRVLVARGPTWGFFDLGVNAGAQALAARVRTNSLDAGEESRLKLWDMVRLNLELVGAGQIRFGFGNEPGEPEYWSDWQTLATDTWPGQESVYLTVEVRSTEIDVSWALTGIEIFGELTGWKN